MMRPLRRLHGAIRALRASPDGAVPLDVRATDELGDLAREFDALMTDLRTQRTELATMTDASPTGLFRCDTQGQMVYVNDAYLEIHGLARTDAAQGWLSLVDATEREAVWRQWQELVQSALPQHLKRWLQRSDGEEVLVSLNIRPILKNGRVTGQVGTLSDITQRTRAEKALRTLSAIFESTTDYVVQLDKTGKLTYMNPAARAVTELTPDAPIAHLTMADFCPPATVARYLTEVVPAAVANGVWVGESGIWDAEHTVFPVSHMVLAHRDSAGKIEHFSGIMRNISAAKATERALSESEARLRTVADALPMRVAYIDANERYQFANLAYEGVFGITRDSIRGQTGAQLFGEARYRTIEPHVRAVLAGRRVSFENELSTPTDYACYEVNYIPQRSGDGLTVVGFHAVTLDITRQKREERRLVQLASQDPLTGLGNRSAFEGRLAEAMEQCRLHGSAMALLYVDLDRFKQINDRWGHPCGDALLRAVAARLSKATRNIDFVARLGGDEFTVILQALGHADDAQRVARKILKALNDPFVLENQTLDVSASVGVACYQGGDMTSDALIRKADEMLYQAKGAGRNNVQVAPAPEAIGI
jgi:diguanylate cyclase (GGDEF)-like protein/PAS domain S-box-containing protein